MAKLSYLGPEWTFSHDLARAEFPKEEHVPQPELKDVVESVATGSCNIGLIPFYNTTRLSIEESQIELVKHAGKVFVTDVLPLEVKHHVGGFGKLGSVREFRSKKVVFHQISEWLKRRNLGGVSQIGCSSTSAAVKSVANGDSPTDVAVIGTASAFRNYKVPVLEKNIHNTPNVTLFFVIKNEQPELADVKRVLMCLKNPSNSDKLAVEAIVSKCGCNISSNWPVTFETKPRKEAYFFEINGTYSSLGLKSAVAKLKSELKKAFVLGGYSDKCITRLL
jgi:prephenate dehydratase